MAEELNEEVIEVEPEVNHGNTRLPYGIAKGFGLDTTGKTPRQVWDMLKGYGVSPENEYDKLKERATSETKSDIKEVKPKLSKEELITTAKTTGRILNKYLTEKKFADMFNGVDEDGATTTLTLFNDDSFRITEKDRFLKDTAFYPSYNRVCLGRNDINNPKDSVNADRETFYHESWHAIDNNYSSDRNTYLSKSYKLANGKTFDDVLMEERKNLPVDEIVNEVKQVREKYLQENNYEAIKGKREALVKEYNREYIEYLRMPNGEEKTAKGKEIQVIYDEYNKADKETRKIWNNGAYLRDYANMGDVINALTYGEKTIGVGHEKSYWYKSGNASKEAFAEIASSKIANPKSYALFKKYLPETVKAFEEIYNKLKTGELKSNAR